MKWYYFVLIGLIVFMTIMALKMSGGDIEDSYTPGEYEVAEIPPEPLSEDEKLLAIALNSTSINSFDAAFDFIPIMMSICVAGLILSVVMRVLLK